jgi:hypothetical protein
MGSATIGEFLFESSLRIVLNSSPSSSFTSKSGVSSMVHVEERLDVTSSVDVAITKSLTPCPQYLPGPSNHCLESLSHTGDCSIVLTKFPESAS